MAASLIAVTVVAALSAAGASAANMNPGDDSGCAEDVHCIHDAPSGGASPSGDGWGVNNPGDTGGVFDPGTNPNSGSSGGSSTSSGGSSSGGSSGGGSSSGGSSNGWTCCPIMPAPPAPGTGICHNDGTIDLLPGQIDPGYDPCETQQCIWQGEPTPGGPEGDPEPWWLLETDPWDLVDVEEWIRELSEANCEDAP